MSDFERFQHAKDRLQAARNLYNYASLGVELEQIKCRLAELKSTGGAVGDIFVNEIISDDMLAKLTKLAHYIVTGRTDYNDE